MSDDELARRKQLTFEQVEGVEPLPAQLNREELSPQLKALLWEALHVSVKQYSGDLVDEWQGNFLRLACPPLPSNG
jgi:hypothetical protein